MKAVLAKTTNLKRVKKPYDQPSIKATKRNNDAIAVTIFFFLLNSVYSSFDEILAIMRPTMPIPQTMK